MFKWKKHEGKRKSLEDFKEALAAFGYLEILITSGSPKEIISCREMAINWLSKLEEALEQECQRKKAFKKHIKKEREAVRLILGWLEKADKISHKEIGLLFPNYETKIRPQINAWLSETSSKN